MYTPLLLLSLTLGAQFPSACEPFVCPPTGHTLKGEWRRHAGYHERLYLGYYERPVYNYRVQFDYPSFAGPSRLHWPIDPPPPPSDTPPVRIIRSAVPVVEPWDEPLSRRQPASERTERGPKVVIEFRDAKNPLR